MSKTVIDPIQAKEQLWRMGHLSWLLDKNQQDLYSLFHTNPAKVQTWLLARRSGKSYSLCVLAIEYCIQNPRSIVKYVAPTKQQVERLIRPIINNDILSQHCPEDIKPRYNKQENIYYFPNGSEIQLCGSESGNIESIRGGFAHICIVDEAQDVSELNYAIKSVLSPTTLTTNGKILMSGTPPKDADHEFITFIEKAQADGTLIRRTIYDNPRLTPEQIQEIIDVQGGVNSEDFRREFLCEVIKSKSRSVLPEVTEDLLKEIVKEWPRPAHFDGYTSMDIGLKDWTVLLFAYYDFRNNKVVIDDEIVVYGPEMHLPVLTNQIKEKEEQLWTNKHTGEFQKPKRRVSDHNLIVINEIRKFSGYSIHFELADKRAKMAGINRIRTMLADGNILINPRCKTLIRHLKDAKWASTTDKDTFGRCPFGSHYDAVDALVYLINGMDFSNNPYPRDYDRQLGTDAFRVPGRQQEVKGADVYRKILNMKKGKLYGR
jgi:hypothetical protein